MSVGVPTEVESDEYRVAITPAGVGEWAVRPREPGGRDGPGRVFGPVASVRPFDDEARVGFKESGHGRDPSVHSLVDYTEIRHVMISLE